MSDLTALAGAKFGKETLTDAEKLLLEKIPNGEPAICATDQNNNPEQADNWGPGRQIRAALVAWLCQDQEAREQVHSQGIQVYGADVTGPLSLALVNIPFQLAFRHCRFKEAIYLSQADVAQLDLQGSLVGEMKADRVNVKNYVLLREGFKATGNVWLLGARIGADLDCSKAMFINPAQQGVAAGTAFFADQIEVKGSVLFRESTAVGGVRLRGAEIGTEFDCSRGKFTSSPNERALDAVKSHVRGGVVLSTGFSANGEVALGGAQIDGDLACVDGTFTNPPQQDGKGSGCALNADGIYVTGSALLRRSMFSGEVRLPTAQIRGSIDCDNATFNNPPQRDVARSGDALTADGIDVKGGLFIRESRVSGRVRLASAQIGSRLDCSASVFTNPQQKDIYASDEVLDAGGMVVKGDVVMSNFTAAGKLDFAGSQIGGAFSHERANLEAASLDLENASAGSIPDPGAGNTGAAADNQRTIWPRSGNLYLDGFVYGRISSEEQIDVTKLLNWLSLQPSRPFRQQPYLQLAKVLTDLGDSKGGLRVREEKEALRRRIQTPSLRGRLWSWLLKVSIGYGYDPGRAIRFIILLSALGWMVYSATYPAGTMVPTDKDAFNDLREKGRVPPHYPAFSPLVYSVENSLPLVKLGQADKWQPYSGPGALPRSSPFLSGFVLWFYRMQILLGWLLGTLFVAGVSGIVHKE